MIHPTDRNNLQSLVDRANSRVDSPITMIISGTAYQPKIEFKQYGYVLFDTTGGNVASSASVYISGVLTGLRLDRKI